MSQPPPNDPYLTQPSGYPTQTPAPYQSPASPVPAYQQQGYGYPPSGYGPSYPEASQATLALVFGIVGIVVFSPLAPFAWWIGGKEKRAVDAGLRNPANRGQAVAGWILGIIGTILLGLGLLAAIAYIIILVVVIGGAAAGSSLG